MINATGGIMCTMDLLKVSSNFSLIWFTVFAVLQKASDQNKVDASWPIIFHGRESLHLLSSVTAKLQRVTKPQNFYRMLPWIE